MSAHAWPPAATPIPILALKEGGFVLWEEGLSESAERERAGWGLGQRERFSDVSGKGITKPSPGGRKCLQEDDSGIPVGSASGAF